MLMRRLMIRRLIKHLQKLDEVKCIERHNKSLRIIFKDGSRELWANLPEAESVFSFQLPNDPFNGPSASLITEKQINPFDDDIDIQKRLFVIRYKHWERANFVSKRVVIHKLIGQILQEGWTDVVFNHTALMDDLEKSVKMNLTRHIDDKTLVTYISNLPGRVIMEQFTDWADWKYDYTISVREAWSRSNLLLRAINKILYRRKSNVNKHKVLWALSRIDGVGVRFLGPSVYRTIIKCFNLSGKVLADPYPNPARAFGAYLEGCTYYGDTFTRLGNFLRTEFFPIGNGPYDCVFLDNCFVFNNNLVNDLEYWRNHADSIILYVTSDNIKTVPKPNKYLKIRTKHLSRDHNYLFYYE